MAKQLGISLSTYLSKNFTSSFMTIFLPLFFIGSLVFIIKISSLTASIQITFLEMAQLFSYNLPSILFYILPVSFLVAVVITLLRLSNDNELMALFSLGTNANGIMKRLFLISFLFTIIMLMLSLALMPKTHQQFKAFQQEKASQAQININPSKLGQKFGDLFIYVKSKTEETMNNIVIYKKDNENSDQLFIAKKANFETKNSLITLTLKEGSGYTFSKDALEEINYESMKVFQNINSEAFTYNNIVAYWIGLSKLPNRKSKILFFIFISLIPMMGLYMVSAFSIINPRYNKNYAYHILALTTIVLFGVATVLKKQGTPLILLGIVTLVFLLGYTLFKRNVLRYF
jgi:lipopolysaccharide export system permease protein